MFDFDPDEWLFLIVAVIVAGAGIRAYLVPIFSVPLHGKVDLCRAILIVCPIIGLGIGYVVIQRWSDSVVKGRFDYVLMFLVDDAGWLAAAVPVIGFLGISLRDDAIERNNLAAALSIGGALLAVSILYAFSNVGGGPTIWTTLLPAAVAGVGLGLVGLLCELIGDTLADDIAIGRDIASGIRLAGVLLGAALILGRAAGGDWKSWNQTWTDFALFGWPVLPMAVAAGMFHRAVRPTPQRPQRSVLLCGVIPAAMFVFVGLLVVACTPNGFDPSKW